MRSTIAPKRCWQREETLLRRHEIDVFRFFDQRTYPIDALACGERPADGLGHLVDPIERHGSGVDGLASGGFLTQLGYIHVAEIRQHQRARDRGSGQHQDVDRLALPGERETLMHAKPMLLVDHCERKIAKLDLVLEQGMRPDENVDLAESKLLEDGAALAAAFATGQNGDVDSGRRGQRRDGVEMLTGQNFRGRHQGSLAARLQ